MIKNNEGEPGKQHIITGNEKSAGKINGRIPSFDVLVTSEIESGGNQKVRVYPEPPNEPNIEKRNSKSEKENGKSFKSDNKSFLNTHEGKQNGGNGRLAGEKNNDRVSTNGYKGGNSVSNKDKDIFTQIQELSLGFKQATLDSKKRIRKIEDETEKIEGRIRKTEDETEKTEGRIRKIERRIRKIERRIKRIKKEDIFFLY